MLVVVWITLCASEDFLMTVWHQPCFWNGLLCLTEGQAESEEADQEDQLSPDVLPYSSGGSKLQI